MPPCYFFSFQVYETPSSSVIACGKRGVSEPVFDWRERREGRRCERNVHDAGFGFLLSFFLVGKGILIFAMLSGIQCVSQVYAVVGNTASSSL